MFFSKRIKKSFEIMEERNRRYLESVRDGNAAEPSVTDGAAGAGEEEAAPSAGEISEDGRGAEAQAAREIEEEIGEDVGELAAEGSAEDPETAEKETVRRMRYAPVRDLSVEEAEEKAEEFHREENKLEKGDIPAMILSAILVFGPIFLVLGGILALAWILLH